MALTIKSVDILKEYINGVVNRADHHALGVNEIVFTLAGAVLWKATEDIEVRTYNEKTANMLWFKVNEKTYCMTYNHSNDEVELKERNNNGSVIATFDNSSSAQYVKQIFTDL